MQNSITGTHVEKGMGDLHDLVQDGEKLLRSSTQGLTAQARQARHALADALEKAKATGAKVKEKAVDSAKATDKVIRDHPYPSIGIAFGIGLLIGVLINRK